MRKLTHTILVVMAAMIFFGSCDHKSKRLEIASRIVEERPDSASVLLAKTDYFYLDESDKAKYILTKAIADASTGRTLVTDTLLPVAVNYYERMRDTINWLKSNIMYVTYLHQSDRPADAVKILNTVLPTIHPDSIDRQYQLRGMKMQMLRLSGDYSAALSEAEWLMTHTRFNFAKFRSAYIKMALLLMMGDSHSAALWGDSIMRCDYAPAPTSPEWTEFMGDLAEILDEDRQSQRAIAIAEDVLRRNPDMTTDGKVTYYLSLAKYNLNVGNPARSAEWLDSISATRYDPDGIDPGFNDDLKFLRSVLDYSRTGRLHMLPDKRTSREMIRRHRVNADAIAEMNNLSAWKMQLTLEKQNVAIVLLSICLALVILASVLWWLLRRRRKRLVEAEERIDTLSGMLKEVNRSDPKSTDSDNNTTLKRMVLRQMGLLKTFASAPTAQNQEVLKKISGIASGSENSEKLVDWENLYAMIDQLYDGFHARLLKAFPDMFTEKEIQIICLLKADFATKEIGVLTQQSSATVYVRKTAIRKKLDSPEGGDIMARIEECLQG